MVLLFLILLTIATTEQTSPEDIAAIFDTLLAVDDIQMEPRTYQYRLAIFTMNYLLLEENRAPNLDLMFTEADDERRNGAKLNPDLQPNPEIQIREESRLRKRRAPPVYSATISHAMNEAVNQMNCGNCYLHVFVAAMEIAYTKFTGELVKFSEQELTDCYYGGCEGGDMRMVAVLMATLDKMAARSDYGPYVDGELTCRTNSTPDALRTLRVSHYISVTVDTVEESISTYGSVMACMAWPTKDPEAPCYMKNYEAKTIYRGPEIPGGCDHAVLIVGYTPGFYIVRNSHGKTWGDEGYFWIERGTNACGIEDDMSALVVETRKDMKSLESNGCPTEAPQFCEEIHACVAEYEDCIVPDSLEVMETRGEKRDIRNKIEDELQGSLEASGRVKREEEKKKKGTTNKIQQWDIGLVKRDEEKKKKGTRNQIEQWDIGLVEREEGKKKGTRNQIEQWDIGLVQREEEKKKKGTRNQIEQWDIGLVKREDEKKRTTNKIQQWDIGLVNKREEEKKKEKNRRKKTKNNQSVKKSVNQSCSDKSDTICAAPGISDLCYSQIGDICPVTCGKCDTAMESLPTTTNETTFGSCYKPTIKNGVVTNDQDMLAHNEVLKITCDAGYRLSGQQVTCLIQDTYTNSYMDSRLLPECLAISGETLLGNGTDYAGTRSTAANGVECGNWNADVLSGLYMNDYDAGRLLVGNHNFCRNPGGEHPVPWCLSGNPATGYYCFEYPGCDTCSAEDTDNTECDLETARCEYSKFSSRQTVDWYWENCKKTCCQKAACI